MKKTHTYNTPATQKQHTITVRMQKTSPSHTINYTDIFNLKPSGTLPYAKQVLLGKNYMELLKLANKGIVKTQVSHIRKWVSPVSTM